MDAVEAGAEAGAVGEAIRRLPRPLNRMGMEVEVKMPTIVTVAVLRTVMIGAPNMRMTSVTLHKTSRVHHGNGPLLRIRMTDRSVFSQSPKLADSAPRLSSESIPYCKRVPGWRNHPVSQSLKLVSGTS